MEAICILLGEQAEKVVDTATGQRKDDWWKTSVSVLGNQYFLKNLLNYKRDEISPQLMKRIREKYVPDSRRKAHGRAFRSYPNASPSPWQAAWPAGCP